MWESKEGERDTHRCSDFPLCEFWQRGTLLPHYSFRIQERYLLSRYHLVYGHINSAAQQSQNKEDHIVKFPWVTSWFLYDVGGNSEIPREPVRVCEVVTTLQRRGSLVRAEEQTAWARTEWDTAELRGIYRFVGSWQASWAREHPPKKKWKLPAAGITIRGQPDKQ